MSRSSPTVGVWRSVMWIAAVFTLLTGVLLLSSDLQIRKEDPLKSLALKQNKQELRNDSINQALKSQIRHSIYGSGHAISPTFLGGVRESTSC